MTVSDNRTALLNPQSPLIRNRRAKTEKPATPLLEAVRQLNWHLRMIEGMRSNLSKMHGVQRDSIPEIWRDHVNYGLDQLVRTLREDYEDFKKANPPVKTRHKR